MVRDETMQALGEDHEGQLFLAYLRFSAIFTHSRYFCLIRGGVRRPCQFRHSALNILTS